MNRNRVAACAGIRRMVVEIDAGSETQIDMEHSHLHNNNQDKPLKNLIFAIVINGGIVAVELVFGPLINHATLQILPVSDGAMAHCNHCN